MHCAIEFVTIICLSTQIDNFQMGYILCCRLTDLSWSPDGRTLVASSTDGFCSVITFSDHELGEALPEPELDDTASHPGSIIFISC